MDSGEGRLLAISEEKHEELERKQVDGIFREGETVEVKGSLFKVHAIRPKKLILKLLTKGEMP